MRNEKLVTIIEALEIEARASGYDLVDVELGGSGRNSVVRVFLDKPDGLNLDDIAAANVWVSEVIDRLEPFKGSYTLEVSSPGIDRPLRTLEHFAMHAGKQAHIELERAENARRNDEQNQVTSPSRQKYTGMLLGVQRNPNTVLMQSEGMVVTLEFERIKKAHLKGEVSFENRKEA